MCMSASASRRCSVNAACAMENNRQGVRQPGRRHVASSGHESPAATSLQPPGRPVAERHLQAAEGPPAVVGQQRELLEMGGERRSALLDLWWARARKNQADVLGAGGNGGRCFTSPALREGGLAADFQALLARGRRRNHERHGEDRRRTCWRKSHATLRGSIAPLQGHGAGRRSTSRASEATTDEYRGTTVELGRMAPAPQWREGERPE